MRSQITQDALRRRTSRPNRSNREIRSRNRVAARIISGSRGLAGFYVRINQPTRRFHLLRQLPKEPDVHALTGRQNDEIRIQQHGVALIILRIESTLFIPNSETPLGAKPGNLSVLIRRHRAESPAIVNLDALFLSHRHFFSGSRHFFSLLQADQFHGFGA